MKRSLIILTAFILFFILWYFNITVRMLCGLTEGSKTLSYTVNYVISALIPIATLFLLHKPAEILKSMGLALGLSRGLLFAVATTLPMTIGYALIGTFNYELSLDKAVTWIVVAGLFEELIYRGFVFGQLFRYAGWGFIPAALLTALVFGSLHLYQGHDLASALGSFAVTALGSLFFSWIYVEWNYNLWSVIWLHVLMNAPWILFSVSDSGAVGGFWANMLRGITIGLAIGLTILYKRKQGLPYYITTKTLIRNA